MTKHIAAHDLKSRTSSWTPYSITSGHLQRSATLDTKIALDGSDAPYRIYIVFSGSFLLSRLYLLHNWFCFSRVYTSCMLFSHRFCRSFLFADRNCFMIIFRVVMYTLYVISWKSHVSCRHHRSHLQVSVIESTNVHSRRTGPETVEASKIIMAWTSLATR